MGVDYYWEHKFEEERRAREYHVIKAERDQLKHDHDTMLATLTAAQARCTELLEENRRLRSVWLHEAGVTSSLLDELSRARAKHPACTRERFMVALAEEVGELAKEVLEGGSEERVHAEALQVACVAMRIVLDATDRRVDP
jgi:hypothetical protein